MNIRRLVPPGPPAKEPSTDDGHPPSLLDVVAAPHQISNLPRETIVPLLCQLSALQSALTARLVETKEAAQNHDSNDPTDQLLTPTQAAAMMGVTKGWIYRHAHRFPFTKRLGRKTLRFSKQGLKRWIQAKL